MDFPGNTSEQVDLLASSNVMIGGGGIVNIQQDLTHRFDMRPYNSLAIMLASTVIPTPPTNFNEISCNLWGFGNTAVPVWEDTYGFWASGNAGYSTGVGECFYTDSVRAPYLTLEVTNNGPDQCSLAWSIFGSTRTINSREIRSALSASKIVQTVGGYAIAGGITHYFNIECGSGYSSLYGQNSGAGSASVQVRAHAATGPLIKNFGTPAGSVSDTYMNLPQDACVLVVTATGNVIWTSTIVAEH